MSEVHNITSTPSEDLADKPSVERASAEPVPSEQTASQPTIIDTSSHEEASENQSSLEIPSSQQYEAYHPSDNASEQTTQVPLYAAENPAKFNTDEEFVNAERHFHASDNTYWYQPQPGGQPYVQVPVNPVIQRPIIRKTGPNAGAIFLGSLLLGLAAVVFAIVWKFPNREFSQIFPGLFNNPVTVIAIVCGLFGAILVCVAILWSVSYGVHAIARNIRQTHRGEATPDTAGFTSGSQAKQTPESKKE